MSGGGPMVSLWDALSAGLWLIGFGLVGADTAVRWDDQLGQMTVIGMTVVIVAAVMTLTSVVNRAKDELLAQMHYVSGVKGGGTVRGIKH